jgi:hypothetical protein
MWLGCLLALWTTGLLGVVFLLVLALVWDAPWLAGVVIALIWWRSHRTKRRRLARSARTGDRRHEPRPVPDTDHKTRP